MGFFLYLSKIQSLRNQMSIFKVGNIFPALYTKALFTLDSKMRLGRSDHKWTAERHLFIPVSVYTCAFFWRLTLFQPQGEVSWWSEAMVDSADLVLSVNSESADASFSSHDVFRGTIWGSGKSEAGMTQKAGGEWVGVSSNVVVQSSSIHRNI